MGGTGSVDTASVESGDDAGGDAGYTADADADADVGGEVGKAGEADSGAMGVSGTGVSGTGCGIGGPCAGRATGSTQAGCDTGSGRPVRSARANGAFASVASDGVAGSIAGSTQTMGSFHAAGVSRGTARGPGERAEDRVGPGAGWAAVLSPAVP